MDSTVLFTGGGSGGHVFPGLAVIEAFRERNEAAVAWIGSTGGMERRVVRRFSIPYIGIPTGKLRRYLSLRNLSDIFRILAGIQRSIGVVRRLKPSVLFSKGGFVSVPPVLAARLLGVPVLTHESDLVPGLATRINARFADRILVAYKESVHHLPARARSHAVVTGNPVRREIALGSPSEGRRIAGFTDSARPTVFFVGGSQGAQQINQVVRRLLPGVLETWNVVHQTGHGTPPEIPGYFAAPFFGGEYAHLLAASDLLVCRSGAGTLWEAASVGTPMLLVPLISGSRGDQLQNARLFERHGAAHVLSDPVTLCADVAAWLERLKQSPREREEMAESARRLVNDDATDLIVREIERIRRSPGSR